MNLADSRRKRILIDIDGVLADFVSGAAKLHGKDPSSVTTWHFFEQWGMTAADFWNPLGRDFWASLPLTVEAHWIMLVCETAVTRENICLLTSPCDTDGCLEGKRDWVRKHFPEYKRRLLIGAAKEFCASPQTMLVDDHDKNCDTFMLAGGWSCLFPRPWNRCAAFADFPVDQLKARLTEFMYSV